MGRTPMTRNNESDSDTVLVVRHGVDKQGDGFTSTFELRAAEGGELVIGRHEGTHPPKNRHTPEEFVACGYHLKADCPHYKDGVPIHLRDDFDGDFDAIPDCDRPQHRFHSVHDPALDALKAERGA